MGRRPSEDKIALYVRKSSNEANNTASAPKADSLKANGEVKMRDKKPPLDDSKKNQLTSIEIMLIFDFIGNF